VLNPRPDTEIGDVAPVPVNPPGLDTTVYDVIVDPLLLVGGVKVTDAPLSPTSVAVPITGATGTAGVLTYGPVLGILVPTALVAVKVIE
jgi:hypothetical protein